ncbi:hypothetical protein V2J09_017231 [Rumex salicifolius]
MDLNNQGNGPDSSSNIVFKRKRGRPRKDQSQTPSGIYKGGHIQDHAGHVQFPPKFTMTDGNHSHQQNSPQQNDVTMVGQPVNGVIEATFEAGYFISIRIGNSESILRGVVLKPGHCLPPSFGKDLGPQIEMASGNAVPFSAGVHTPVQSSSTRGKCRAKPRKEPRLSQPSNGSSSGNDLIKLLGDRGSLVPVVLKPANLSSGLAPDIAALPALSKPAHLAGSKPALVNQTVLKQMEKKDNGQEASKLQGSGVKLTDDIMGELASDIAKKVTVSSRSNEMQSENRQPCGVFGNEQRRDLSKPFLVKPLHGMFSGPFNQFQSFPLNYGRPGKMTELLLGNVISKQAADVQNRGFSWH